MPHSAARRRSELRARVAASRVAPLVAMGIRLKDVARYDAGLIGRSASWVWNSREFTNYSYDLTDLNMEHLSWWVAAVTGTEVAAWHSYRNCSRTNGWSGA